MSTKTHYEHARDNVRKRLRPLVDERTRLDLKKEKTQEDIAAIEDLRKSINVLRKEERKLTKLIQG